MRAARIHGAALPGSYAEYLGVPASEIIAKPQGLTMQEAAVVPTVAIATHRFLIRVANLQAVERVLVHGGAGGVGSTEGCLGVACGHRASRSPGL